MKEPYDKQEIAQLLDKFMAGETTLNEEQTLTTYFRTHEVDEEWKEYKEMFVLFDRGQVDIEIPTRLALPLRWLMAGIAASIILLIGFSLLMKGGKTNEETPEIAQQSIKQHSPEPISPPTVEEKKEAVLAEVQPTPQPVKKHKKAARKQSYPVEPVPTEAGPMNRQIEFEPVYLHTDYDQSFDDFPQIQDIRSKGERLQRMVDAMINE